MKIAIVGGAGKMGRWFASWLQKEGHDVIISGRDQAKLERAGQELGIGVASNTDAVRQADAVILSVPIDSFEPIVREVSPVLHQGQLVFDVTSVKTMPVELMHRYGNGATVLGVHPLFGPGALSVANQNFVLTPISEAENDLAGKVKAFLETRRARVTIMSPREHDNLMTVVLGLAHYIAIVSADTILSVDRLKEMQAIGGITYKVLLTLIESVLSEDPGMYATLQMNLPGAAALERRFQQQAETWAKLVEKGDRTEFARRMAALREKLEKDAPDFGKAYQRMYRIAED